MQNIFFFQYSCYAVELLPALAAGAQLTYGTIAIDEHQKEGALIRLDDEIGSWFGKTTLIKILNI